MERNRPEAFSCQPTSVDGSRDISTLSESTVESAKGPGLAQLWHSWVCQTKRLFVSPFTEVTYEEPFSTNGEDRNGKLRKRPTNQNRIFPRKTGHFVDLACPNAAVERRPYRTFGSSSIGLCDPGFGPSEIAGNGPQFSARRSLQGLESRGRDRDGRIWCVGTNSYTSPRRLRGGNGARRAI